MTRSAPPTAASISATHALELWFEFGSNYSYLAVMRINALASQYGVSPASRQSNRVRLGRLM
jgi:2-hydroxychromene-2-carboxylate isomerase